MRRTCERPGCGEPVAVIYGHAPDSSNTVWVDSFGPERVDGPIPIGTMGFVCVVHGERLSPPRGWTIDDRRIAVPRLFKVAAEPRSRPTVEPAKPTPTARPASGSTGGPKKAAESPRTSRKDRTAPVPRPSLFAELPAVEETSPPPPTPPTVLPAPEPVGRDVDPPEAVEPERIDDSTEIEIRQDRPSRRGEGGADLTGDATRPWIPTFDPDDDLNGLLDATTPLLRDAFRSRHNGRQQRDDS